MEDTIEFILQTAIKQGLSVGSYLELRPLIQNPNPVIRNNLYAALEQLFQDGIFEKVDNAPKLTEAGFRRIWHH